MNIHDLDTPALLVDLDRLERNIHAMAALVREGGKRLRPHIKTHKTPQIARMQTEAGARGLTVAKLGEAEVMADAGFHDLFIANQIVGAPKLERLMQLADRVRLSVGVDSLESAEPIAAAARRAGTQIEVMLEVDTGLHRAGVREPEEAVALGLRLAEMQGLRLRGIFTHEGHAYRQDAAERAEVCAEAAAKMRAVADGLRGGGVIALEVSVGSTPGAAFMARMAGVDEMRPGVYVFSDATQVRLGAPPESCALTVLTTVTSRPEPSVAIADAGTKALSPDRGADGLPRGCVLSAPEVTVDWASEEHAHLDLSASSLQPHVGDKLRLVPYHACSCLNMHETLHAVRGEKVEEVWHVAARGRMR